MEWRRRVSPGQADWPWHYHNLSSTYCSTYSEYTGIRSIVRSTYTSTYTGAGSASHPSCTPGTSIYIYIYRNYISASKTPGVSIWKTVLLIVPFCRSRFSSSFSFFRFPFVSCIALFAFFSLSYSPWWRILFFCLGATPPRAACKPANKSAYSPCVLSCLLISCFLFLPCFFSSICSFIKDKTPSYLVSADWVTQWCILYKRTKEVPLGSIRPPTDNLLRGWSSP